MSNSLWTTYKVSIAFRNGIAGSIPLDENIARRYIDLYGEGVSNMLKLGKKREGELSEEHIDAYLRAATTVFRIDEQGPYIRDFQVRAMLRDASKMLNEVGARAGLLAFTIANGGVAMPERMHFKEEPRRAERPVAPEHKGRRKATLAVFQVIDGATLTFPVQVVKNEAISFDLFKRMWRVAQEIGLGGFRHLGYGKFDLKELRRCNSKEAESA
ncbi:hypothetical protein LCGC14_2497660 [marine sediment metagenome]|uniref:Uncharacterized protein n=1 Tax=marine sediment metagenome TaxID=412755 RepID=A0A0F9BQV9_9ZZZZ